MQEEEAEITNDISKEELADLLFIDRSTVYRRFRFWFSTLWQGFKRRFDKRPEGVQFLDYSQRVSKAAFSSTEQFLAQNPLYGGNTFLAFGDSVQCLDMMSGCSWGCKTEDHIIEHLLAKCDSQIHSSLLLLQHGYYDESLQLTRSLGESANLLMAFAMDESLLESWKKSTSKERKGKFSPGIIRKLLSEGPGSVIPMESSRYATISERFVHSDPKTKPGVYNPIGRPMGGVFQPTGMVLALNELSIQTAWILFSGCKVLGHLNQPQSTRILESVFNLQKNTGAIQLDSLDELFGEPD